MPKLSFCDTYSKNQIINLILLKPKVLQCSNSYFNVRMIVGQEEYFYLKDINKMSIRSKFSKGSY